MEFVVLGSGGAIATPRPFCKCAVCKKARKFGEPFKRNCSSLFVKDINAVVDCGEDIGDSLNRRDIKRVDSLFITHWHPDHTFGLRPLLESSFNFRTNKPKKKINIFISKKVYNTLKKKMDVLEYYSKILKVAKFNFIEHNKSIKFGKVKVTPVGYTGMDSTIFGFLFEQGKKRVFYSPCDTMEFSQKLPELDLLITECGVFSYRTVDYELSFPAMIDRIKEFAPKKTILTHIEEDEIGFWGEDYLKKMKKKYSNVNFDFAFDGMKLKV